MTVVIVILVAALVAIVVGVVVLPNGNESSVVTESSSSTVDEMTSPFFAALPNATMASLQDVESPQSQALEWLFGHPNYGTMEDWKRIQPFAMVT
ncbi:expressed unknown protein [Seminavis robusta]|uniref:Uncharacterized protein n=1 Tax=Seminavis robusta TaxID=568900 RepID=A0A9N8DNH7_9STRA|nr:expressed unknown protein [Seminavis robusta]|eukprot:Sro153_g069830.1 n/a (95) ;mRNA; r:97666-97950